MGVAERARIVPEVEIQMLGPRIRNVFVLGVLLVSVAVIALSQRPAPRPFVRLTVDPTNIEAGKSSTLRWSSRNATSASIDQGIGAVPTSGSREIFPAETTVYTIVVKGPGGEARNTAIVAVRRPRD